MNQSPLAEIGHREIADQLAVVLQHRRERHAARLRQPAGEHAVEPGLGALPGHAVLGEARDLRQADAARAPPRTRARRARNRSSGARRTRP